MSYLLKEELFCCDRFRSIVFEELVGGSKGTVGIAKNMW